MRQVMCPWCRCRVLDDGSVGNQAICCSHCGRAFAAAPELPVAGLPSEEFWQGQSGEDDRLAQRPARKHRLVLVIAGGVTVYVLLLAMWADRAHKLNPVARAERQAATATPQLQSQSATKPIRTERKTPKQKSPPRSERPANDTSGKAAAPAAQVADAAPAPQEHPPEGPLTAEEIFERASPAVVQIVMKGADGLPVSQGSGFLVNGEGLVVTNAHVVRTAGATTAVVLFRDDTTHEVDQVHAVYPEMDLAVLNVPVSGAAFLVLSPELPRVGARAYALGNPLGIRHTISDGIISGYQPIDGNHVMLQTTAPISPGSSGGPLLDERARVVGVTTGSMEGEAQNLNFAVPASAIEELLRRPGAPQKIATLCPPAQAARQGNDAVAAAETTVQERVALLQQVLAQRETLLAQRAELEARFEELRASALAVQAKYARVVQLARNVAARREAAALQLAKLSQMRDSVSDPQQREDTERAMFSLAQTIQQLEAEYAQLDAEAACLQVLAAGTDLELIRCKRQLDRLYAEASQLRREFLRLLDPFGHLQTGDRDSAINAFTAWILLDAQNAMAYIARGLAHVQFAEYQAALADFDRAVTLGGNAPAAEACAARAWLRAYLGEKKASEADFRLALKHDQRNATVYIFRALVRCREGKFNSATADLKTAIRYDPADPKPHELLALVYATCQRDAVRNAPRALYHARKACELTGFASWSALLALAAAHAEAGEWADAHEKALAAAAVAPTELARSQCMQRAALHYAHTPLRLDWSESPLALR